MTGFRLFALTALVLTATVARAQTSGSTFQATPGQCAQVPELDQRAAAIASCRNSNQGQRGVTIRSCFNWFRGFSVSCNHPTACTASVDGYYSHLKAMGLADVRAVSKGVNRAEAVHNQIKNSCVTKAPPPPPVAKKPPPKPPLTHDVIHLKGISGTANAVVLVDGQRTGKCVNDESIRGNKDVPAGNLTGGAGCPTEVVVLAKDNALALMPKVATWTQKPGDELTVTLSPVVKVPLTIWILRAPYKDVLKQAKADVARANSLLNRMQAGFAITTVTYKDVTADKNASALLTKSCADVASFKALGFTKGRLNVYYVEEADGNRGEACRSQNEWNAMTVGSLISDGETLIHEIGHVLTLEHTNSTAGVSKTNLMLTGETGRNQITTGQVFRMNVNKKSMLNVNGNRTGTTRTCDHATADATCPAVSLDVKPK